MSKSGKDPEVHIRQVIGEWLNYFLSENTSVDQFERVYKAEMNAENTVCFAVAGMYQLIRTLKAQGKRTIFISDMYLGSQEIAGLLANAGFDSLLEAGYVSSDIGLNKKSSRLYEYVIKKEQLRASELLHVGDNYYSDVQVPYSARNHAIQASSIIPVR